MNILYYSCHHILEDDEVRLLKSMGHHVFVLGSNVNGKTSSPFRPAIECDARETVLNEIYCNMGGKYGEASKPEELIPDNFLCHFSLSIVMHDHRFITENWGNLRSKPLIWRTIGQGVDIYEDLLRPYRADGMHIVRYSPVENNIQNSLGQDAIIRFYKNDKEYCNWNGQDIKILTFANSLSSRYHTDSEEYRKIAEDMPFILGGTMNDDFRESLGFVSPARSEGME